MEKILLSVVNLSMRPCGSENNKSYRKQNENSPFGVWWILRRREVMGWLWRTMCQVDRWKRQKQGHFPSGTQRKASYEVFPTSHETLHWGKCLGVVRQQETLSVASWGLFVLPGEVRRIQKFFPALLTDVATVDTAVGLWPQLIVLGVGDPSW